MKQALADQGIVGEGRSMTERAVWVQREKEVLAELMLERGIEWEQKGEHREHLSVLEFKREQRTLELAELEHEVAHAVVFLGRGFVDDVLAELALRGALYLASAVVGRMIVVAGVRGEASAVDAWRIHIQHLIHGAEYLRRAVGRDGVLVVVQRAYHHVRREVLEFLARDFLLQVVNHHHLVYRILELLEVGRHLVGSRTESVARQEEHLANARCMYSRIPSRFRKTFGI